MGASSIGALGLDEFKEVGKVSMEVVPKKRTKKKVSSIQMPSPASKVMNQFVGHDNMDGVRARKIKKEKELGF